MKIFTIGDLHLSMDGSKPMSIFGPIWEGHAEKIKKNWNKLVEDEDVVVIVGDISWAMDLDGAFRDFEFIDKELTGKKLIIKGNHDYWWSTVCKMKNKIEEFGFKSIDFIHNNAFLFGDIAICGTRGWFLDPCDNTGHNDKVFKRELQRLEASLAAGARTGAKEIIAFLHYPPVYQGYECIDIIGLIERFGVKECYFGHLHGASHSKALNGIHKEIKFELVSCDYISFMPVLVRNI